MAWQTYSASPVTEIGGVGLVALKKHRGANGWFMEWLRMAAGQIQCSDARLGLGELRQISISHAEPGRINAFHIHPKLPQNELWSVVSGQLLVWLVDCRAASPAPGLRRPVILTAEEPAILVIPSGVAHGYQASRAGALLLYAADASFDPQDPNEGRLPWDYFGRSLWQPDLG